MSAPTMPANIGPGGMPVSRRQMFDDMLIPEEEPISSPVYRNNPPMPQGGPQYSPQQNFRQSGGSVNSNFNRPPSRSSSGMSVGPYGPGPGMGYPPPQQQQQQFQNYKPPNITRPSSRASTSGASVKSGFFGGRKKNKAAKDFDEDFGEETGGDEGFDSMGTDTINMKQLAGLMDRDRYPTMGGSDPNQGRTMSLTNTFDTTPIIPTLGAVSQDGAYRKNLISRNQKLRADEYNPSMMNPAYGPPGGPGPYGMRSPTGSMQGGRPMSPQEAMRLRSMSNASYGRPPGPEYNYAMPPAGPGATSPQGRSMSLGGYSRGPPPNMMGVMQGAQGGPGYGMRPPIRKSLPNGPGPNNMPLNGAPPNGIVPNGISHNGVPPVPQHGSPTNGMKAAPNGVSSQVSLPNGLPKEIPPAHSRSSSKSSSPSPAANSMSRPNSQALSASSSVPDPLPTGKPELLNSSLIKPEPIVAKGVVHEETQPLENYNESAQRQPEAGTLNTPASSLDADKISKTNATHLAKASPIITRGVSPIPEIKPKVESVERATSPVPIAPIIQYQEKIVERVVPMPAPAASHQPSAETVQLMDELKQKNMHLLDEVRLVTSELADSIRRELGLSDDPSLSTAGDLPSPALASSDIEDLSMNHRERATLVLRLQTQLDVERRKRLIAEDKLHSLDSGDVHIQEVQSLYNVTELNAKLANSERTLSNKEFENETLREELKEMNEKFEELSKETTALKTGKTELNRDLELLTAAGNPVELLQSIDELKVENKKLTSIIEENSSRGPLGEKIKAIESQRDALREALRSLRERKDHEIRQYAERVRQLDSKLEKERLVNSQIQRKYVQNQARTPSATPTSAVYGVGVMPSPVMDSFNLQLPKRRGANSLAIPGNDLLEPDSPARSISPVSRQGSPSPAFSVSSEPSWKDNHHSHREQLPGTKFGHSAGNSSLGSIYSYSSASPVYNINSSATLSLPNGRSEQIPLSLGNGI